MADSCSAVDSEKRLDHGDRGGAPCGVLACFSEKSLCLCVCVCVCNSISGNCRRVYTQLASQYDYHKPPDTADGRSVDDGCHGVRAS